jgi:cytochrome c peroxidase
MNLDYKNINRQINTRNLERYENVKESLQKLLKTVSLNDKTAEVRSAYLLLRKYYKEWEYMAIQKDAAFIKDEINPAPLPKTEDNSFGANIIESHGLQKLDELIFEDTLNKVEIINQIKYLVDKFDDYVPTKIYDRDVFEGCRIGLIRVFTLGLTGYDTPGSINSINDASNVIKSIHEDLKLYYELINTKDSLLTINLDTKLIQASNYLKENKNFETFNRYYFLKKFINPLFKYILTVHKELGIELPSEVNQQKVALNYNSENLFSSNFINSSYYIQVPDRYINNKTQELGKLLFFDPIMSGQNERSCASCHNPNKGFTDQLAKSIANGKKGYLKRNSPTLINSVYTERLFHDMRARTFMDQMEHVLTSKDEFDSNMIELLEKINQSDEYVKLFKDAFQLYNNNINGVYIQMALSVYISSLIGLNSEFDKSVRDDNYKISENVINGFNLFMGKAVCGTCHFAPIFNGTVPPDFKESESEVIGVPENPYIKNPILDLDEGRGIALLKEKIYFNKYAFKTPTVRNSALTFPYMHNGAYEKLEDVVEFYNKGGGKGIGIEIKHQTLPFDELKLSRKEIKDIVSFMNSLTDTSGIIDKPKYLPKFENKPEWNLRVIGGLY